MPKFSLALVGLALSLLPSAGQAAEKFTFEDYFAGRTEAVGSFSAINGVKRTFTVDLTGNWDGKTLTLREDFVFDDGTKDRKTWRFTKTSPTTYSGTRDDICRAPAGALQISPRRPAAEAYSLCPASQRSMPLAAAMPVAKQAVSR